MNHTTARFSLLTIFVILLAACTLSSGGGNDTPAVTETPTPPVAQPVALSGFFGAPEGQTSPYGPIGCDSYLIPVQLTEVPANIPPDQHVTAALSALFSISDQLYTADNLFNALSLSSLSVSSVTVDEMGHATIAISGSVMLSGVCADAIFAAQIETTAQQIIGITGTTITINGTPLADVISGRGE